MTFAATFSSAVFAAVGPGVAHELRSSPQEVALATSLFVFGFAAGPVVMARPPRSTSAGRPVERGVAVSIFAATTLVGPPAGAIVGAALLDSPLGWRWAAWLSMILGLVFGGLAAVVIPETYVSVLLRRKARQMRFEMGNWTLHSKGEETPVTLRLFVFRYLTRLFSILLQEPILMVITLYVSFTFGMVYYIFVVGLSMNTRCRDNY